MTDIFNLFGWADTICNYSVLILLSCGTVEMYH